MQEEKFTVRIKNMVCDRCILTVRSILSRHNIGFEEVSLGEVLLRETLTTDLEELLQRELQQVGFELIEGRNEKLVNKIKSIVIKGVYDEGDITNKNLSAVLTEELHMDYSYLSSIFSRVAGKSILSFENQVKTERIKELLEYEEMSISEIADSLGYGSAAYLSTQFKKNTGFSPSEYRLKVKTKRRSLDRL